MYLSPILLFNDTNFKETYLTIVDKKNIKL